MSSSGGTPTKRRARLGAGKTDKPHCPKCQGGMSVKQVSPVLFASDFDEMIYRCDECGAEIKRTVRRK
jgi:ribosomal protein L37AE/L43A